MLGGAGAVAVAQEGGEKMIGEFLGLTQYFGVYLVRGQTLDLILWSGIFLGGTVGFIWGLLGSWGKKK